MGTTPAPGSLVFTHASGIVPWAIRLGERLRWRSGDVWSHVAVVSDEMGPDGSPLLIEALSIGVTGHHTLAEQVAGHTRYEVVGAPEGVDVRHALSFARAQIGRRYGFLTIAYLAAWVLIPRWVPLPVVRSRSTWICSALAAEALRAGGWLHEWPDIYSVAPAELFSALHGMTVRDVAEITRSLNPRKDTMTPTPTAPAPTDPTALPNWTNVRSVSAFLAAVVAFVVALVAALHPGFHLSAALLGAVPAVALLVATGAVLYLVIARRQSLAHIAASGGTVPVPTWTDPASVSSWLTTIASAVFAVLTALHVAAMPASLHTLLPILGGIVAVVAQVVNQHTAGTVRRVIATTKAVSA